MKRRNDIEHNSIEMDKKRILSEKTPFGVKEAYRTLYTNILYLPIEDKCKKIAISSTYSGEGKTTVSINMAITMAINSPESKILLIDSDLRSPRLSAIVGCSDKGFHGLSEYLAGIDNEPNIQGSDYANLSILSSGAANVNSPGLLSSTRFKALMDFCADRFDYVIIDTPPVGIVSDAILLNEAINGYILVTRANSSDVNSIADTLKSLESVNAKVLGFVLSSYNAKTGGGYGKYARGKYGKYNRYGRYNRYNKYAESYNHYETAEKDKE